MFFSFIQVYLCVQRKSRWEATARLLGSDFTQGWRKLPVVTKAGEDSHLEARAVESHHG